MPIQVGTAFLGMIIGGVTFLISGAAVSLAIGEIEGHAIAMRAPVPQQQQHLAQFAHNPPLQTVPARN